MAARRIYALSLGVALALALTGLNAAATSADPVDSNGALFPNGGCYSPPIVQTSVFDQLVAVNPEWAPVVNGSSPFSAPVLVHGTAVESHVSQQDFPAAHVQFDQNTEIVLDPADRHFLATGNYFAPNLRNGQPTLELEWETGSYPAWAWAGEGNRVVALGRWIFDCGHPDPIPGHKQGLPTVPCLTAADAPLGLPCIGAVFNYRSELHPPQATAVIRSGGAAVLQEGEQAVPVTRADVYVSADGGGSGDACVVTHKASFDALLGAPCFPLRAPLALMPAGVAPLNSRDFTFDVPLPALERGREPILQVLARPTPALGSAPVTAPLRVVPHLDADNPYYEVTVRMTQAVGGAMPTGFAATMLAGWQRAPKSPVVHLRVTLDGVVVNNALKPTVPGITIPPGWKMQTEVNGLWQEIGGLGGVNAGSVGQVTPLAASYDLYLPRSQRLDLHVDAASIGCVDTLFAHTLLEDLIRFGFNLQLGLLCLGAEELNAGSIDVSFGAPAFGTSDTAHQVTSTNGAFTLRFRIEQIDGDFQE